MADWTDDRIDANNIEQEVLRHAERVRHYRREQARRRALRALVEFKRDLFVAVREDDLVAGAQRRGEKMSRAEASRKALQSPEYRDYVLRAIRARREEDEASAMVEALFQKGEMLKLYVSLYHSEMSEFGPRRR